MIRPVNNQVVVSWKDASKKELEEQVKKSGLVLPETVKGETKLIEMGEVVACADKIVDRNGEILKLKVGDKVLFLTFHPFKLMLDGKEAFTLPASEIVAIIGDGKT